MKKTFLLIAVSLLFLLSCKVTFISGYDQVMDETLTRMKNDFNLHFTKLKRTIQDDDSSNQKYENFQNYYDQLVVDTLIIYDRSRVLGPKASKVKTQISNLNTLFANLIRDHKKGFSDSRTDDKHDIQNGINSAINAVLMLQEQLKSDGKIKS